MKRTLLAMLVLSSCATTQSLNCDQYCATNGMTCRGISRGVAESTHYSPNFHSGQNPVSVVSGSTESKSYQCERNPDMDSEQIAKFNSEAHEITAKNKENENARFAVGLGMILLLFL